MKFVLVYDFLNTMPGSQAKLPVKYSLINLQIKFI